MVRLVQSNPENIYVATDYKKIGKSFEIQRQRVTNVISSISRASAREQEQRIEELVGTDGITDSEKGALRRELDSIIRDFEYLGTDTRNADLSESDEYFAVLDAYNRLVDLMTKIVNSVGTYTDADVYYLTPYYSDYTSKAITLQNLILATTAEIDRINAYYAMTRASVIINPEAVGIGDTTDISASLTYEGIEKISYVSADCVTFGLAGLSDTVTSSMFTFDTELYPDASVTITALTHSAIVENCKEFTLAYGAISEGGVFVSLDISLDSDSMPF